jgi:phage baseplate assembly protein W
MATVRLNNLIKPKQINTQQTKVSDDTFDGNTYTDLHLDLKMAVAIGTQLRSGVSNDIKVSFDEDAISNSVFNCIHTKPGEKVLDPDFGMNLDQFLFEPLSEINGDYIGRYLSDRLSNLEPRISIQKVYVNVLYNDNLYRISIVYNIPSLNREVSTDIVLKSNVMDSK